MENFDDLKKLWQEAAPQNTLSVADVISQARKHKRKFLWNGFGKTLLLLATAIYLCIIISFYHSKMISTRIGELCVLIAVFGMIILNSRSLQAMLRQVNSNVDVHTYLAQLKVYQQRMRFIQTTGISVYFILFTAGLGLYFYELTHTNLKFALLVYGLTGAWIAFNWFYIRPRTIRKQNKKLDEAIAHLERLSGQLD
jgi:hypothetical protein